MGKAVKAVGNVFGLGSSATYSPQSLSKRLFDISKEVKPFAQEQQKVLERSRAASEAAAPARTDVLRAMGEAAAGRGPSLAEAQLKAAQDRNLAQQLAAVQAGRGGGALAQRSLLQNMASSGRDLAQQAAVERLKERSDFLTQAGLAEQGLRSDIGAGLDIAVMPKREQQKAEMQNVTAANEAARLSAQQAQAGRGALLGGLASLAGGAAGAGLFGTTAANIAAGMKKKDGGVVEGPGTETSDSVPAWLSKGEFVVKASEVKKPGVLEHLTKLNNGELEVKHKGYKKGGKVKDEAMEVLPDRGFGKIIIIDKNKDNEYAEGGLVKENTSLADALMKSRQDVMKSEKESAGRRPDASDKEKKKKLIKAIEDAYRVGPKPMTPAGERSKGKK